MLVPQVLFNMQRCANKPNLHVVVCTCRVLLGTRIRYPCRFTTSDGIVYRVDAAYYVSSRLNVQNTQLRFDQSRYAAMGSCRQLAVGPEALFAVLLGSILENFDAVCI